MSSAVLNPAELAERWGISRHRIYVMARKGQLPTLRLGKSVRFRLADVEKFEARNVTDKPRRK